MNKPWVKVLIGVPLAAVLAISVGTWAYITFVHGKAPAAFSLDTTASTATTNPSGATTTVGTTASTTTAAVGATTATGVAGTWKVGTGSIAGYRVKEVLFGQSAEAVGRTKGVTGQLTIDGTTVTAGSFTADMTTVASNESRRDGQFRGRIMEVSTFPTATFQLTQPIAFGTVPDDAKTVALKGTGSFTIHGVTRNVTIDLTAQRTGTNLKVVATIPVVFASYNISNPSGGPAQTEDHGTIEVLLVLTK